MRYLEIMAKIVRGWLNLINILSQLNDFNELISYIQMVRKIIITILHFYLIIFIDKTMKLLNTDFTFKQFAVSAS